MYDFDSDDIEICDSSEDDVRDGDDEDEGGFIANSGNGSPPNFGLKADGNASTSTAVTKMDSTSASVGAKQEATEESVPPPPVVESRGHVKIEQSRFGRQVNTNNSFIDMTHLQDSGDEDDVDDSDDYVPPSEEDEGDDSEEDRKPAASTAAKPAAATPTHYSDAVKDRILTAMLTLRDIRKASNNPNPIHVQEVAVFAGFRHVRSNSFVDTLTELVRHRKWMERSSGSIDLTSDGLKAVAEANLASQYDSTTMDNAYAQGLIRNLLKNGLERAMFDQFLLNLDQPMSVSEMAGELRRHPRTQSVIDTWKALRMLHLIREVRINGKEKLVVTDVPFPCGR